MNFATDRSGSAATVRWGTVASGCTANSASATRTSITVNSVLEYQWYADLSLVPDTEYCYRVYLGATDLLGTDPSPHFWTQVPAGSTKSYSFAVFGDWGSVDATGNSHQANVMQRIANSGARFAITTGDTAYPTGSQANYGDLTETGSGISAVFGPSFWTIPGRSMPLFNPTGNHGFNSYGLVNWPQDRAVSTSNGRYVTETYCCLNGTTSGSYPSAWYAFDAGTVRFYILEAAWSESNVGTATQYKNDADYHWTASSAEYQWLANDLAGHPDRLKIALFHYPLYSDNAGQSSDVYLQGSASLEGLLGQYGVQLAFNGHTHMYERNNPNPWGMVSYVTGGGGAQITGPDHCSAFDAYAIGWSQSNNAGKACKAPIPTSMTQIYHFLLVTVSGTTVTVTPTDELGRTFDVQTYTFNDIGPDTTPPTAPSTLQATAPDPHRVDLTWSASTDNVSVTGYVVWRDGAQIATLDGNTRAYSDATVASGSQYTYTITAVDAAGNVSPPSNEATVTTPATINVVQLTPTDDAYVEQGVPDANFGIASSLKANTNPLQNFLLRFDITGLSGQTVTSAKLRLYCTNGSTTSGGVFHLANGSNWSQGTITWNNAPPADPNTIATVGPVALGTWVEIDVTSVVSGDGVLSLRVTKPSGAVWYSSKEGGHAPQLVLTFVGP